MADSKRKRRQFSTEEKAGILRRHMVDKVAVSDLCNELGIQPSLFYYWQRQALENLAAALSGPAAEGASKREKELAAENRRLEERLARKDSVIAEIKRRSPSMGEINPAALETAHEVYREHPLVSAISILTQNAHFGDALPLAPVRVHAGKPNPGSRHSPY